MQNHYAITTFFNETTKEEHFLNNVTQEETLPSVIGNSLIEFLATDLSNKQFDDLRKSNSILIRFFIEINDWDLVEELSTFEKVEKTNFVQFLGKVQEDTREALKCILDEQDSSLKSLTVNQRVAFWQIKIENTLSSNVFSINPHFNFSTNVIFSIEPSEFSIDEIKSDDTLRKFIKNIEPTIYKTYNLNNFIEVCKLLILQMITNNIRVKRCECCGKYFIINHKLEKYCDRIYINGRTCKAIGYEQKIQNEIFHSLYRTAYKTKCAKKASAVKATNITEPKRKELKEKYTVEIFKWQEEMKPKVDEYKKIYDSLTTYDEKIFLIEKFKLILKKPLNI